MGKLAPNAEALSRDNVCLDVVDPAVEMYDKQIGHNVLDGNGDPSPCPGLDLLFYGVDVCAAASGVGASAAALPGACVPERSAADANTPRGRPRRGIDGAGVPASKPAEEGYDFSRGRSSPRGRRPV